jgi:hypothetical protein
MYPRWNAWRGRGRRYHRLLTVAFGFLATTWHVWHVQRQVENRDFGESNWPLSFSTWNLYLTGGERRYGGNEAHRQ